MVQRPHGVDDGGVGGGGRGDDDEVGAAAQRLGQTCVDPQVRAAERGLGVRARIDTDHFAH